MKVFKFKWDEGFGTGVMLVAAGDKEEAEKVAENDSLNWYFEEELVSLIHIGLQTDGYIILKENFR